MLKSSQILFLFFFYNQIKNFPILGAPYTLGTPTLDGTGCPTGSVQVVESTNGEVLSILFSHFQASTDGLKLRDRKICNIRLPMTIKQGYRIGVFQVDYRGNAFVPSKNGSKATFKAKYFYGEKKVGRKSVEVFPKGYDDDFLIQDRVKPKKIAWTKCGTFTIFGIDTILVARKKKKRHPDVSIVIDSIDISQSTSIQLHFRVKKCKHHGNRYSMYQF